MTDLSQSAIHIPLETVHATGFGWLLSALTDKQLAQEIKSLAEGAARQERAGYRGDAEVYQAVADRLCNEQVRRCGR